VCVIDNNSNNNSSSSSSSTGSFTYFLTLGCVRLQAMTRESKVKQLQVMDSTRRQLMNYTQQQKETELARLDDDIRRKV